MKYLAPVLAALVPLASAGDLHAQAAALDRPLRAVHLGGNWAANRQAVEAWEGDRTRPLLPSDYVEYLRDMHVDWVGISVALHVEDSMDSTVERAYSRDTRIPTFSDDALRQIVREHRQHGFDVYLTLAFEAFGAYSAARPVQRWQLGDPGAADTGVPPDNVDCGECPPPIEPEFWPWRPSHPDHDRFVREFWSTYTDQAVHFARIAQDEGVRMYSLGTETERLFRTRPEGAHWTNDFGRELGAMADSVRAVYDGLLTYDMHFSAVAGDGHAPRLAHLWEDLDLDVVGISAWFPLAESLPATVMSVDSLRRSYERILADHILPLAAENAGRPIVFLEYGAVDVVGSPLNPDDTTHELAPAVFSDSNGNGLDDGQETQANVFQALLATMDRYAAVVYGAFFWNNWIVGSREWGREWAMFRSFSFRDKLAEEVVRRRYDGFRPLTWLPTRRLRVGGAAVVVPVADAIPATSAYRASSSAPDVATVSVSGSRVVVTPVAEGAATVTLSAIGEDGAAPTLQFTVTVQDLVTDPAALEALYRATGGDDWTNDANWLSAAPLADWYGVEANRAGRVTGLRLGGWDEAAQRHVGNGLTGSLPAAVGTLARLRRLLMEGNRVTGPIPAELGNLADLRELRLGGNEMTGTIPGALANLTRLEWLSLWGGTWTPEPAPAWLGAATSLRGLDLGGHRLTGPLPPTWRNLGELAELRLWGNALTGSIPAWLATLANLRVLVLHGNPLTGPIPPAVANLANLSELDLGFTVLSGPVPAAMTRLSGLARFDIEGTGVCVPDDAGMQAWLAAIPEFVSSGLSCGTSAAPVTVAFDVADYTVTEGDSAYVRLRLSEAPTPVRAVSVAVTATAGRGGTAADYRVPGTATFRRNATEATIEVTALRDGDADDGETVTLGFGALPPGVTAGAPATVTVTLRDDLTRFTDAGLTPGETVVRGIHVAELRQLVDVLRARCDLPGAPWTDRTIVPGQTPVRAVHLTELRAALGDVYGACSLSPPTYADPLIEPRVTPVRAVHWTELRDAAMRALEATAP